MSLPVIDATPSYVITLPISEQETKYRPYKVGEELGILTASNSEDKLNIYESFTDTVKRCIQSELNYDKLTLIDFSYILLHIRAKSKGELVEVEKTCSKCQKKEPFTFDILKTIEVQNIKNKKIIIDVTENIKLELGSLPYTYLKTMIEVQDDKEKLAMYALASSVKKVVYNGKIFNEFTPEEVLINCINNFTEQQLKMISKKLKTLPKLVGKVKCKCSDPECGHEQTITLDDLPSFLE